MRFILANLQKNCRIRLNYFKADSLFKNNLHIKTEPVTDGADTKNQTYIVASAPSVTGSVFMQRFKLNFWHSALGRVATCPKPANDFVRCTLVLFSNTWHHYMWPFVKFLEKCSHYVDFPSSCSLSRFLPWLHEFYTIVHFNLVKTIPYRLLLKYKTANFSSWLKSYCCYTVLRHTALLFLHFFFFLCFCSLTVSVSSSVSHFFFFLIQFSFFLSLFLFLSFLFCFHPLSLLFSFYLFCFFFLSLFLFFLYLFCFRCNFKKIFFLSPP